MSYPHVCHSRLLGDNVISLVQKRMTTAKIIFTSKTFWLAVLQGILGVLVVIGTQVPELGWVTILKSIIDIGLRMMTTEPVRI